ncbi:MAG: hypothetical protein N4A59_11970 [Marinifilum sp.]|nr:hypothetical protein [Marinifilum sp.]
MNRRLINKRCKAGALQYVVLLSLLIFFLVGMFILRAHYSNQMFNQVLIQEQLMNHLESTKVLLKNNPDLIDLERQMELNLFDTPSSIVGVDVRNWGVYKKLIVQVAWQNHRREECFLLGDNIWEDNRPSLFLSDKNRYLSVCGETWLGGPVQLPALGVRKSYVDGVGYYRERAVQGQIGRSEQNLPALRGDLVQLFETNFNIDFQKDSVLLWENEAIDSIFNSYRNNSLCLWSPEPIAVSNVILKGNIRLVSKQEIFVGKGVNLDNCILAAPKVYFENNFKGRVQIFAKDTVIVGNNSHFLFPSVIFMSGANGKKELEIKNNVRFAGEIVLDGTSGKQSPVLKLGEESRIEGFAYCNGTVELKGDVAGSLYTNRFILRTPSALYENHLLNNRLDVSDLNANYVGVSWFEKPKRKQYLECLF